MGYTVATRYTLTIRLVSSTEDHCELRLGRARFRLANTIRLVSSTEDHCVKGKAGQAVRRCFPRIVSGGPALLS